MQIESNIDVKQEKKVRDITYNNAKLWEAKKGLALRDLTIKKIVVAIITLLNFGALGVALYYVISYCPVPTSAILVSPFIAGAIAALVNLKFPTLGVKDYNYANFGNPLSVIGKVVAYIFFGPLMIAVNKIDWTPYYDPIWANKISLELESKSFEEINQGYHQHWKNLVRYGFVPEACSNEFIQLDQDFRQTKGRIEHLQVLNGMEENIKKQLELFENQWEELKSKIMQQITNDNKMIDEKTDNEHSETFPHPRIPEEDYTKWWTEFRIKVKRLLQGNPIDPLKEVSF